MRSDHRRTFLRRNIRLSIGHISPEAAAGGNIGLVNDGDIIEIDIPKRTINVKLSDEQLAERALQKKLEGKKLLLRQSENGISLKH